MKNSDKVLTWQAICAILGILLILSIITKGFIGCPITEKKISDTEQVQSSLETEEQQESEIEKVLSEAPRTEVDIDGDNVKGLKNAPVTIVEFSNFQCSACRSYFLETYPKIVKEYINTGKVRYVIKPIGVTKYTEGIYCAGDFEKFWEMHDLLFSKRSLSVNDIDNYAEELGIDIDSFNSCMDSRKYSSKVNKLISQASEYNVYGTPLFFVNGIRMEGAYPYEAFREVVEFELKR